MHNVYSVNDVISMANTIILHKLYLPLVTEGMVEYYGQNLLQPKPIFWGTVLRV